MTTPFDDLLPGLTRRAHHQRITVAGEAATGADLLERAERVAGRIAGAKAVAVDAVTELDTVVAVVAGLRAGVPVVPVAADSGPAERAYVLADSGAELLITSRELPDDPAHPLAIATASVAELSTGAGSGPAPDGDPAPALVMYTSGTTGRPKGVMISRRAIAADLDGLAEAWQWSEHDTLAHGLPLFHVHGLVLGVLGALRTGSDLVHTGRPTPQAYAAAGGTLYFGVPTVWGRVVADPASATTLRSARLLVSGSAALPVPVFEGLAGLTGHRPIERYGMTETLITVSTRADGERRPGWVGRPVSGVEVRVVDENGTPTPADGETPGHVQVRGATLFDGYLANPDATAAAHTPDGWFVTGDVALHDADGWIRLLGRASTDLISSGGYRIGAGEVEDALLAHPGVREAAVVGLPDADLGEIICAYVVADGVNEDELTRHAAEQLSKHKRPRRVVLVDSLPRNAMGKVVKSALG